MQPALRAYLTKLREDAYVDIRSGYVDSGASAKQTKPVFTAYAAPTPKKKKVSQKQRLDRKGFVPAKVGAQAEEASAAAPAVSANGRLSGTKAITLKRQQKIKREKVRFGQAPRNALPAGTAQIASGSDTGAGAASAAVTPGGIMQSEPAPGTAIAPTDSAQIASVEADPLAPTVPAQKKMRYSSQAKGISLSKAARRMAGVQEKQQATPIAMTSVEQATTQTQSAPLGLNGDTAPRKKKTRVKGARKERLQQKAPEPKKPAPEPTPYRTPATPSRPAASPSTDTTTLPPATAPAPGAPPNADTTPATPGTPIPTPPPGC
jgi:peptidyl-prolyl cis-trans isomerase SurA